MADIDEIAEPIEDPIEILKRQIYAQTDAKQTLIIFQNSPFKVVDIEIIESKILGKGIRSIYLHRSVENNGEIVGLAQYDTIQEEI